MLIKNELKSLLSESGLTESEILTYLELLKSPAETRWELVKRTGLNRNKLYRACEKLIHIKLIAKTPFGIEPLPLDSLVDEQLKKLKRLTAFHRLPCEIGDEFEIADTKEKILEQYIKMSEIKYDTCMDFGDLEGLVPILGGMDPVFKFRVNRYKQMAQNRAICTTTGPFTACMARKSDMEKFNSNIDTLKINFKGKWIIFSDTDDHVMFNDFSDPENPHATLIKSRSVANTQRLHFDTYYQNLKKF